MNQTEAIKKAEDRLNLCIHISECSENKGRDKRRSTMSEIEWAIEKKEYIERGALLKAFGCENAVKYGNKNAEQQHKSYSSMMLYEIADEINDAPAADVEPVGRGEWEKRELSFGTFYRCSICGETISGFPMYKFCHACGAHMERSRSGE